ncbi:hypothetical protein TIFTF001_047999 [Ficus carica]|uniref:PGG domain-containing protein n=1 Tax=Ficus carica TaxID=3494 RepID=A0AA88CQ27_FICCA|nr:hypothetical protein TIFTF001_047999 [Ficus carica]
MPPSCRGSINKEGLQPVALFTKKHKELVVAGEDWMTDTSTSCIIVGALIVIITFAAAFTVPGENNQETGFSISTNKKLFKVFIMSDVMSLFLSTTSVLVFSGIFTSRYAEEDFLKSMPKKMVIGLSTLFFSIATAMIAFCVSVPLILPEKWIAPLVGLLARMLTPGYMVNAYKVKNIFMYSSYFAL